MKIYTTQLFLDERDRFEARRVYEVETAKAEYFIACGWAVSTHDVPEGTLLGEEKQEEQKKGFLRRLFRG